MEALTDTFGRMHNYLRISLTERCNLRCSYCMPAAGVPLSPKAHLMTADEVFKIAQHFVNQGVTKIRLTGGEPLVRKDAREILEKLGTLPVELAISTNAVIVDRFIDTFKAIGLKHVNVSLDSLDASKFASITRRNDFDKVKKNIDLLLEQDFIVKLNCVLIKNFNRDEIVDFIKLSKTKPLQIRFIEFMPFDGNQWDKSKLVSYAQVMDTVYTAFPKETVLRIKDQPNDTAKNYKIEGAVGSFAVISTVTNPFCDSCNRIRLTANGQLKNCLFSGGETDLLTAFRAGKDITPLIAIAVKAKFASRGGMDTIEKFSDPKLHNNNRSMITIGG